MTTPPLDNETVFTIDVTPIKYGAGALREVGQDALSLGMKRVGLFTDKAVGQLPFMETVKGSLTAAGIDFAIFDDVHVEPSNQSFLEAAAFAKEGDFDGYLSIGGGSVMDTCKAANLYATYPADFLDYVNAPIGKAKPVPGPLKPHIACPTTSGTGSECTGITICDIKELKLKSGIASPRLKPSLAVVDPITTETLPPNVVASTGFDVLTHAIESFTARPFTERARPQTPGLRPMSQGANPYSDHGSLFAIRLGGEFLVRAVTDPSDSEARHQLMFAATLAGVAFGNSGVHIPHAMSYAVAGLKHVFKAKDYPSQEPFVPHG
ncbi:MAG: iron-containing alcohol dehydrogenase, partial [Rhodospirillales bacterium]|nr:iron-containing alcohol dehydrogenase [Rhodospirillales bacterium]